MNVERVRRESWPWEATGYFVVVVVMLVMLAMWDIRAAFAGLVIHVASYQLGRP